MAGQDGQSAFQRDERVVQRLLLSRLVLGGAHDRLHAEQNLARVGIAPGPVEAALDVSVVVGRHLERGLDGEDALGKAGGELPALCGGAGLEDGGAVLRGAHHRERPARSEVPAAVLDPVHLGGVGEDAVLAVHHHGVGLPAIPECQADLHELLGPVVALVGGGQLLAVVRRLVVVERGDDVPRRAAACQVVERGPEARGIERVLVADGEGRGEADRRRDGAHPRQQRDGVVVRHLGGVAQRGPHRAGVGVGDEAQVREEHHVELAALAHPSDVLIELGPRPVVAGGGGAGMPPHRQAVIGGGVHQELREVHHPGRHQRLPPVAPIDHKSVATRSAGAASGNSIPSDAANGILEDRDLSCTPRPGRLSSGPRNRRGLKNQPLSALLFLCRARQRA